MADTQYQRVLRRFRSQAHFCEVTGKKQSTVSHWAKSGFIPSDEHVPILKKAKKKSIPLTALDFFPEEVARDAAAA